jgi:hypothetical protein
MAQPLLSSDHVLRRSILNSYAYKALEQKEYHKKTNLIANPCSYTLILPQWKNFTKQSLKEKRIAEETKALEDMNLLLERVELHFNNLKLFNQKKVLEKVFENQLLLRSIEFLRWYRLRRKLWLRMMLQKRLGRKNLYFKKIKKKRHSEKRPEKFSNPNSVKSLKLAKRKNSIPKPHPKLCITKRDGKVNACQNLGQNTSMLWLRNLHAEQHHNYHSVRKMKKPSKYSLKPSWA